MSPNWGVSLKRGCPRLTLSPCDLAPGGQKLPTCWGRLWAWFAVPLGPHPWHTTHTQLTLVTWADLLCPCFCRAEVGGSEMRLPGLYPPAPASLLT